MSSLTSSPVLGSSGIWPEQKSRSPAADRLLVGADGCRGGVGLDLSAVGHGRQTTEPKLAPLAPPETKYARSGDVHIAYQVFGEGDLDLVLVPGFVTHVELIWEPEPSRSLPRGARVVRSRDQLRPPRLRAVGPGGRRADARGAHGRRARGDGRRRLGAGGADGDLRGRPDEHPVRRHLSRARRGARLLRRDGPLDRGRRLPVRPAGRGSGRVGLRADPAPLGRRAP